MSEFLRSDTAERLKINNQPTLSHERNLRRTMRLMEDVRKIGNGPIKITSGYRNPELNRAVGGVKDSDHALGHACDFYFPKWPIKLAAPELATALAGHPTLVWDQFILEADRGVMHISFHPRARRQILTQTGGPGSPIVEGIIQ
jgi:putative chitinase